MRLVAVRLGLFLTTLLAASFAHASVIVYAANLSGAAESPPVASLGTGFATVTVDDFAKTMRVQVEFSGLTGTTTAAHIHCCTTVPDTGTAGVASMTPSFAGFPVGVTSGTYDNTFDLTDSATFNPSFVSANGGTAESAAGVLLAGLANDKAYLNIHTTFASGGEIRGFLAQQVPVPAPATLALLGIGLAGLGLARRRKAQ